MKKTILYALIAVFGFATQATAQNSVLATLHHNGEIKTFIGVNALVEANKVADHGDVITLSSGTFNAPTDTITKAITLRGAGMELDTTKNIIPTIIQGDFIVDISEPATNKFSLESLDLLGDFIYGKLDKAQFLRCRIDSVFGVDSCSSIINSGFAHCIISSSFELNANSSSTLVGCYISEPLSVDLKTSNFNFQNCVIKDGSYSSEYSGGIYSGTTHYWGVLSIHSSDLKNSIICYLGDSGGSSSSKKYYYSIYEDASVGVYNCLAVAYKYDYARIFSETTNNTVNNSNYTTIDEGSIFKGWNPNNGLKNFKKTRLELTDAAKSKYLGSDGTEIGIYGGSLPFDSTPTNPRITKCEVDGKTTSDGLLNVKLEINGAE